MFTSVDSLRLSEGTGWPHAMSIDTSEFPAGTTGSRFRVKDERGAPAESSGEFDVLWSLDSWRPDAADLYEVTATTLMPSDSVLVFRSLSMGDKGALGGSGSGATRTRRRTRRTTSSGTSFLRRVNYANNHYSIFGRGMFSRPRRVYIRYGEPDDVKTSGCPSGPRRSATTSTRSRSSPREQITDTTDGNRGRSRVRDLDATT
jgi:GWxTD domain-containing protein